MKEKGKNISDAIFKLRSLNSLTRIAVEGTPIFDSDTIASAIHSICHSIDTIITDLEEANADALNIKIAPNVMKKLCYSVEEEHRRGNNITDPESYASTLLVDAIGWKYAELFEPMNEEPELSDEELDALGIPVVCIAK